MRLVDVDNIRDILTQDWFLDILLVQNGKKELATELSNMVYSVPVVYDVGKVVEQIEAEIESDRITYEFYREEENKNMQSAYAGKITAFKNAINIIRAGGKELG